MDTGRGTLVAGWVVLAAGLLTVVASLGALRLNYGMADVQGESMAPSYRLGDDVVYARVDGDEVRRGDVVLFSMPDRYPGGGLVMQRVIGVGGDRIVCCEGEGSARRLTVNGRTSEEPYVKDGDANGSVPQRYDVRVPQGRLFLLGDHRLNARDSRFFADDHGGTVPAEAVRGRVTEDRLGVVLLAGATLFGLLLAIAGLIGVLAGRTRRRRSAEFDTELWPAHF
ncbi:signal peptidase I [Streptomyces sp. AC558_RSS880]|uniref:signal peptidase I n=1 Tax=Streptomyces sp. AC558_RSS880 TaxID=2823687 RepID=UPI001C240A20|nr:signal peptidase I [Streptomyces sp. AC558_RSS880]